MFTFLPKEYKREVVKEYRGRVLLVFLSMCIVLTVLAIGLLMPTFMNLLFQKRAAAFEEAQVEARAAAADGATAESSLTLVKSRLAIVDAQAKEKPMVAVLETLLAKPRAGVTISSLTIDRADAGSAIVVKGLAATRESLVAFSQELQKELSFGKVELPVSSLAKSKDIQFAISIQSK